MVISTQYTGFLALLLFTSSLFAKADVLQKQDNRASCVIGDNYSSCYDASYYSAPTGSIPPSYDALEAPNPFYDAFVKMKASFEKALDIPSSSKESCQFSAMTNLTLVVSGENRTVSIFLLRVSDTKSPWNYFGHFYEMISFALARGHLVGRLDLRSNDPSHLDQEVRFEYYLPRLFIPNKLSYEMITLDECKTLGNGPLGNPTAYIWNTTKVIDNINSQTMTSYAMANIPDKAFGSNLSDSVGIHFRCGDNLDHSRYGLIGFKIYSGLIYEMWNRSDKKFNRVVIYTEAKRRNQYEKLCWSLLGELSDAMTKKWLPGIDVEVHLSTTSSFPLIHFSKVAVCSVSTLCFFSTFGTKLVYQPSADLLGGYPFIGGAGPDPHRRIFQPVLLRPRDFPQLNESAFINMVVNS